MMAYFVIGLFLLACALLLWVFPETSILNYGYAEMNGFFNLVPFIFVFFVPAIAMRSFAEERKEGTYVLLATRPLTDWQIIGAKYAACLSLISIALLPTFIYYYSILQLGMPKGNVDGGAVTGSYLGLLFLASVFTSIGIFSSSLTKNQVIAFALAVFICFFSFFGWRSLSVLLENSSWSSFVERLGIHFHFESMSRGVIDTRDVMYFLSFNLLFLGLTRWIIGRRNW